MTFSEKLKTIREEKQLTQKQVASRMGISQQAYGQYESGSRTPKRETIQKLSVALECNPAELDESQPFLRKVKSLGTLRRSRKLTQGELAEETGIDLQDIKNIENGTVTPPIDVMREIARVLHCSLAEIFLAVYDEPIALEALRAMQEADRVVNPWNTIDGSTFLVGLDEQKIRLLEAYDSMNSAGQQTAVERVEELAQLPKYQKRAAGDSTQSAGTGDENDPE